MRALIVEDDVHINDILTRILKKEMFIVDNCACGLEGLSLAKKSNYDLMILDNMLPKKTGIEICRELRQLEIHTPIIILSVTTDVDLKVTYLNSGADDYITKPFSVSELVARVRAILRRPKAVQEAVLRVANVRLNEHTFEVFRGKKEISLTKKEFKLLHLLMKNPNQVITRGAILEHVWGIDEALCSNSIEVHIVNLRKKLNPDGRYHEVIQTISGIGYKLKVVG